MAHLTRKPNRGGDSVLSAAPSVHRAACGPWLALLPEAAEGLLPETEQQVLEQHLACCPPCAEEMAEAQRGLAWLTVLKEYTPAPADEILASILAQTSGVEEAGVFLPEMPAYVPTPPRPVLSLNAREVLLSWLRGDEGTWSSLLQPRLAMTGAMAFLSICLTLNLLGISVAQLDADGLHHGGIERSVAGTGASLMRSFHGLRVVYRVESRVNQLRTQAENSTPPAAQQ